MPDSHICDYCGAPATHHQTSAHVYGRDYGPIWHCVPCDAWVGCHPNGQPLGRLANKELRKAKMAAHAAFDPLWQERMRRSNLKKGHARAKGYKWLAAQLGIDRTDCHIGMMDIALCRRVIEICESVRRPAGMKEAGR